MRLYKYIQKDIQQENLQYQDLVELNVSNEYPAKKSIIRNYLSAMDFYTPTDGDFTCRYRILTKIINKYYNYELFTDNYEYFGNRMLWRLNKIMPTYKAKFNAMLAQNGYEDIWQDGLLEQHREGTRNTKRPEKDENNHDVNFDRTDLNDTTTTVGYQSDYPQVIVGSTTDYNESGDKTTTGRSGNDKVVHALQEDVGYEEDLTRKFSPEEIAKAKLLMSQLIFNIDEDIVNAVADLFILVDYPFEDDFDVAIQMSILDDAKAYTNQKFNESKAYTDQEVAKAKEIVFVDIDNTTYANVRNALSNGKTVIAYETIAEPLDKKYAPLSVFIDDEDSGYARFTCAEYNQSWLLKSDDSTQIDTLFDFTDLYRCEYNQTTFAQITQALSEGRLPYCVFPTGEYFYFYLAIGNNKYRFTESYIRETGITYFIDVDDTNQWGIVPRTLEMTSNKVTSISSLSTDVQYPSAKCVYDALNNTDKVYWATYGNDEFNNISAALSSTPKKAVLCKYGDDVYICSRLDDDPLNDTFIFSSVTGNIYGCKVRFLYATDMGTGTMWATDDIDLQKELVSGTNIKTINSTSLLGSGDIDTIELYECTFSALGTGTTFAQVGQALTDGKIPYVTYDDGTHYNARFIYSYGESGVYTFTVAFSDALGIIYCYSDNTWAYSSVSIGGGGSSLVNETVTLLSASWVLGSDNLYSQGVTCTNDPNDYTVVWASPYTGTGLDSTDYTSAYVNSGTYLQSVAYLSATFKCTTPPSTDIKVNLVMG